MSALRKGRRRAAYREGRGKAACETPTKPKHNRKQHRDRQLSEKDRDGAASGKSQGNHSRARERRTEHCPSITAVRQTGWVQAAEATGEGAAVKGFGTERGGRRGEVGKGGAPVMRKT